MPHFGFIKHLKFRLKLKQQYKRFEVRALVIHRSIRNGYTKHRLTERTFIMEFYRKVNLGNVYFLLITLKTLNLEI